MMLTLTSLWKIAQGQYESLVWRSVVREVVLYIRIGGEQIVRQT